jgi:hypothetical protein
MPEISQYLFSSKELLEILIKEANVHEGRWVLMANFGITPGNYGPAADQMSPGILFAVTQIGIQKAPPELPDGAWLDAAVVNPPPVKRRTS